MTFTDDTDSGGLSSTRDQSYGVIGKDRLSRMLSVLSHQHNRGILLCLMQRDKPMSVEEFTTHVAALNASAPVIDASAEIEHTLRHSNA